MVLGIINSRRILTGTKIDQLFFLLFISDIFFIGMHCVVELGYFPQYYSTLSIATDQSIPEIFQYLKEFWIALVLGKIFLSRKDFVYLNWTLLFLFFLIDDFASLHENLGGALAQDMHFMPQFNLRSQDLGELSIILIIGLAFSVLMIFSFMKSKKEDKRTFVVISALVGLLVFFGVAVDLVHSASAHFHKYLGKVLALLEEGGEMFVMSCILWYLLNLDYFNKRALTN